MKQGEVYWVDFGEPLGSEPGFLRPSVIVQNDRFNESPLPTVMVCPTTSNVRRRFPGRVVLLAGEGGLRVSSVVETSHVMTVDRKALQDYVGQVSDRRVSEILRGIALYLVVSPAP